MHRFVALAFLIVAVAGAVGLHAASASDIAVPALCTAAINATLAAAVASGRPRQLDNVMICGTAARPAYLQAARGRAGSHHVIAVNAPIATGGTLLVEVVTNDALDGVVSAQTGDRVIAYGQFFQTTSQQRPFAAGLHDTHCATHTGADNGWVVINAMRWPSAPCS